MPITVTPTAIQDLLVIQPRVFGDDRGWFFESFNKKDFSAAVNQKVKFVQDNHSSSKLGVLRGLHFQKPPYAQSKLVRLIQGKVLDVAVDLRKDSETFGQWVGVELSEENNLSFYIPPGFAHGF